LTGENFNTKVAYNLDKKTWEKIGNREEWEYEGKQDGKSKWRRRDGFPNAQKAEGGGRAYFCCEEKCFALVVAQGPIREWYFRRHSKQEINGANADCGTQTLINNLPSMDQRELIEAAKTILSQFLNNEAGGRDEFDVEIASLDVEIPNTRVTPSITITHKSRVPNQTFVEIVSTNETHRDSVAWGLYNEVNQSTGKKWMDQLVHLHFKGRESGVRYDFASLPTIIVDQFRRRFHDRVNVSKEWADTRDRIHASEEESRSRRQPQEDSGAKEYWKWVKDEKRKEEAERKAKEDAKRRERTRPEKLRSTLRGILARGNDRNLNFASIYALAEDIVHFYDNLMDDDDRRRLDEGSIGTIEELRGLPGKRIWSPGNPSMGPKKMTDENFWAVYKVKSPDGEITSRRRRRFRSDRILLEYLVELFIRMQESVER
jgi:hypothetical protein